MAINWDLLGVLRDPRQASKRAGVGPANRRLDQDGKSTRKAKRERERKREKMIIIILLRRWFLLLFISFKQLDSTPFRLVHFTTVSWPLRCQNNNDKTWWQWIEFDCRFWYKTKVFQFLFSITFPSLNGVLRGMWCGAKAPKAARRRHGSKEEE